MKDRMVWIDLEMTGLETGRHVTIEIATIVTDKDLNVIAEGPCLVIHATEEQLGEMDDWCVEHRGKSGLTKRVKESSVSMEDAEAQTLAFLKKHVKAHKAPLCGNSIWQDRRFLEQDMPKVDAFLHYRMVDVSSFKEVVKRWYPSSYLPPMKSNCHRALDDIKESIAELQHYRDKLLVKPPGKAAK